MRDRVINGLRRCHKTRIRGLLHTPYVMPLDSWRNFDDCIEAVTTDLYKEAIDMGLPASLPLATAYLLSVI